MKSTLPIRSFPSKLYLALCIDAIFSMANGDPDIDQKIVDVVEPLLEDLFKGVEILA